MEQGEKNDGKGKNGAGRGGSGGYREPVVNHAAHGEAGHLLQGENLRQNLALGADGRAVLGEGRPGGAPGPLYGQMVSPL